MILFGEILVSFFLVVGGIFGLVGSFGLLKLPDTMRRLHAPTKSSTVGVGGVLLASMGYFYLHDGTITMHELLITLFLFLTAPITANFISKAYMLNHVKADELPEAKGDYGWAGYDEGPGKDA
jgi:multicomponent K+:H+ antiporter subunit G